MDDKITNKKEDNLFLITINLNPIMFFFEASI